MQDSGYMIYYECMNSPHLLNETLQNQRDELFGKKQDRAQNGFRALGSTDGWAGPAQLLNIDLAERSLRQLSLGKMLDGVLPRSPLFVCALPRPED